MSVAINLNVTMVSFGTCWKCGVPVYGPEYRRTKCLEDHSENFYCINGHSAVFGGETEAQKLAKQLASQKEATEFQRRRLESEEKLHRATKGQLTKLKNRVTNGVCPCCNRTFKNLQRHMQSKHPEAVEKGRDV